ncbi:hypothetical protein AB0L57_10140 [Nocardia sp. NPDC052254]|uniref:hypothetical protein n=1 Tax=Nocardia sp. NPDC052254 TaxID=3155681 RepID=UPI003446788C
MGHNDDADVLRRMAGLATPMALRTAVTLGLPDLLIRRGVLLAAPAAELAVDPRAERRLDESRSLAAPHGLSLTTVTDPTEQRCLLEFDFA